MLRFPICAMKSCWVEWSLTSFPKRKKMNIKCLFNELLILFSKQKCLFDKSLVYVFCTMESLLLLVTQCSWIFGEGGLRGWGGGGGDGFVGYLFVWQFINLLYVCGNINSWIRVTHEVQDHWSPPQTMMIPQFIGTFFSKSEIS